MTTRARVLAPAAIIALSLIGWGSARLPQSTSRPPASSVPTTRVRRSDVVITVTARGELLGGNSEMLTAPMTGGNDMAITLLRNPGELVKEGDVVVQFDPTEQTFLLKESEADLAEAEQHVIQARAESEAKEEETRYQLAQAKAGVRLAELEVRRNPLVAAIVARQNTLALEAARDRLRQLEQDVANRQATTNASIAIQEAGRSKAKVKSETAKRNIESMTLRAKTTGYVNIQQNTNGNFMYWGMQLPVLQVGDTVRAGMAVAQIPDLKNWEVTARIGELDRGHLAPGQKVQVGIVALAGRTFPGSIKDIGGTTGPPWDRRFDCKIKLENPSPDLRPGISANVVITTEVVRNALWAPSQALFESDGRTFVYIETPSGFVPHDVKLRRRSESQVVLEGLSEGQVIAMASPDQMSKNPAGTSGALKALPR